MGSLKTTQVLAKLEGIEFNARELVNGWILITYDLPVPEGNKIRQEFLKRAPRIGAVMHSRSVYLMPHTQASEMAALELSKIGDVYVWFSTIKDEALKRRLTDTYDLRIFEEIENLQNRLDRINQHILNGKVGVADRMKRKTVELFNNLIFTIAQRGSRKIYDQLMNIQKQLEE